MRPHLQVLPRLDGKVDVHSTCPDCKNVTVLTVNDAPLKKWMSRKINVQDAFPKLNADQREQLITGICPTCWDKMFAI